MALMPPNCNIARTAHMAIDKTSLASQIRGKVLAEGDEGYDLKLKRWANNAEKKAGYIVLVESAEDISKTVLSTCDNLTLGCLGHGEPPRSRDRFRRTFRIWSFIFRRGCRWSV